MGIAMGVPRSLSVITALLGILAGLLSIAGGAALLWGSQDAMTVLIHWIGEERALGPRSVVRQPDGSALLTNPGAMARWVFLIWAVGASQVVAGACLLRRVAQGFMAPWQ